MIKKSLCLDHALITARRGLGYRTGGDPLRSAERETGFLQRRRHTKSASCTLCPWTEPADRAPGVHEDTADRLLTATGPGLADASRSTVRRSSLAAFVRRAGGRGEGHHAHDYGTRHVEERRAGADGRRGDRLACRCSREGHRRPFA